MTNLAHNLQATAGSHPHRVALRQGDVLFTYAQLNGEVARAAAWLADKGVRPGDRVAIMIPNVYAFSIFYYAILRSGAIVVPMNPLYKSREIEYYLGDSGAKLAIIWSESAGEASQAVSTLGVEMIEIDSGFIAMFGKHPDASHIAERFRIGFPPTSRSLDVGEQERHDPRRWVPRGHSHRMSHNALFNAAIVTNFRDSRNSSISRPC